MNGGYSRIPTTTNRVRFAVKLIVLVMNFHDTVLRFNLGFIPASASTVHFTGPLVWSLDVVAVVKNERLSVAFAN